MVRDGIAFLLLSVCLFGCGNSTLKIDTDAVIKNPTKESRTELAKIIASALNRTSIVLADDALTADSQLIIDRKALHDPSISKAMGRRIDKPYRFYLKTDGKRCILVQDGSENRWVLHKAQCVAIK